MRMILSTLVDNGIIVMLGKVSQEKSKESDKVLKITNNSPFSAIKMKNYAPINVKPEGGGAVRLPTGF